MFTEKTVFVVGAGASTDFNLPVGKELKSEIAVRPANCLRIIGISLLDEPSGGALP